MRLIGHIKVSTALAATSFSLGIYMGYDYHLVLTLATTLAIGSVAPDFIELGIIKHRTYTHYPWFYIIVIIFSWHAYEQSMLSEVMLMTLMGLSIGSLIHIICDWPYGQGVPLFLPTKQVRSFGFDIDSMLNKTLETLAIIAIVATGLYFAL